VTTTALDFGLFNLLVASDANVIVANTVAYSSGIAASYLLNKRFTFRGGGRDLWITEVGLFALISLIGLGLSDLAVWVVDAWLGRAALPLNLAKLGAGAAVWLLKFTAFGRWVYPPRSEAPAAGPAAGGSGTTPTPSGESV
jgi:putative flippase GtrA